MYLNHNLWKDIFYSNTESEQLSLNPFLEVRV